MNQHPTLLGWLETELTPTNLMGITTGVMEKFARHLQRGLLGWATALANIQYISIRFIYIHPRTKECKTFDLVS